MKFIEEIVAETFLPTYRSMLAEALLERGFNQSEVAEHLGISQSAVSKYAHGEVTRHPTIAGDERVRALVDRVADGLAAGTLTDVEALIEAEVLIRDLERGDVLHSLHRDAVPALADQADALSVHDPDGRIRERARILRALRGAFDRLERMDGFVDVIPQVGSNLVYARAGASTIDDVAGAPGRIVAVANRATVPDDPDFGVSEHVASVVLAARRGGADHRSAINTVASAGLLSAFTDRGLHTREVAPTADLGGVVEEAFRETPDLQVLHHPDGPGIEANAYLFGAEPQAVVDILEAVTVGS